MQDHPAPRRVAIMGASLAGLMAARVLAEHYDEVVLLERDELPSGAAPRKGTPHAVQAHGLLARGQQAIETLFPGFTNALIAQGALTGDVCQEAAFNANGQRFAQQPAGIVGLCASRLAIEAEIRRRVRTLPKVRFITGVDVLAPLHEDGRVVGVRWQARHGADGTQTLAAALVVDCTGRGSRSPAWLREWGYQAPEEERVTIGLAYTGAYFRRDAAVRPPLAAVIGAATPEVPRPSALIAQEPDDDGQARWVASVGGYAGDHVPTTRDAIAERARAIGQHEIAELAERGEMLGEVMRYGFPHSQRRHYERLRRFPDGYLAMGDALASFNPIYGQGMTVTACEALALREVLRHGSAGLARRFFKAASKVIETPWQLAVGGDLALPVVQGPRPFPVKLINAYVGRVQRVAVHDAVVAGAFVKVVHMVAKPESLFAPGILWRVWRGGRLPVAVSPSPRSAGPTAAAASGTPMTPPLPLHDTPAARNAEV